jgi:hypothetical protein
VGQRNHVAVNRDRARRHAQGHQAGPAPIRHRTARQRETEAMTIRAGTASFGDIMHKRRKYRNTPTMIGMMRFDSKGEAARFEALKLLLRAGQITELKRQVPFHLYGKNGARICTLRVDFTYLEAGKQVAEDFKGVETKDFKIKAKLFHDNYGSDVELRISR